MFYQNILNDLTNLPEHDTMALKPKLRHTCEKYNQIKVPCKYRTVIDNLRRNKYLVILKQDKGNDVVLLDKTVYIDKCLSILNTQKFQQLDISPTAANEYKIQRALRKINSKSFNKSIRGFSQLDQMPVNFMVLPNYINYLHLEQ